MIYGLFCRNFYFVIAVSNHVSRSDFFAQFVNGHLSEAYLFITDGFFGLSSGLYESRELEEPEEFDEFPIDGNRMFHIIFGWIFGVRDRFPPSIFALSVYPICS